MSSGNDDAFTVTMKFSLASTMLSFIIGMLKYTIVICGGNVTMYGPTS